MSFGLNRAEVIGRLFSDSEWAGIESEKITNAANEAQALIRAKLEKRLQPRS